MKKRKAYEIMELLGENSFLRGERNEERMLERFGVLIVSSEKAR